MEINLNLNAQNLGNTYTDNAVGEDLSNANDNLSMQTNLAYNYPIDSISLSAGALEYLDGNKPPPEQIPETVVVIGQTKKSGEASITDDPNIMLKMAYEVLSNIDWDGLTQMAQNQQVDPDYEPNITGPYTPEELAKMKQTLHELKSQNAGKDAKLDAVFDWTLNAIDNATSGNLDPIDALLLQITFNFMQEHTQPSDVLKSIREFGAALYYGVKDLLNGPFNGPFEDPNINKKY